MERWQLLGQRFSTLNPPATLATVLSTYGAALASGFYEDEAEIMPGGALRLAWVHRRLVRSGSDLAVTLRDISDSKRHEQQLVRMAREDTLTGLPNRQWLNAELASALARTRQQGGMLALLFIDLDRFKHVNDSAGHQVGDAVLRDVAFRWRLSLRAYEMAYRLGGEEFLVLLPGSTHEETAEVAERLRRSVAAAPVAGQHVTMSFGVAACGGDEPFEFDALYAAVDAALYRAKAAGRNRVCGGPDEALPADAVPEAA
jgi:diguanylate cyclase (GGDEF)-like protein